MKETVALIVFVSIAAFACFLIVRKRIGIPVAVVLLGFSLLAGWGIANYDWIRTARWQVPGIPEYRQQIETVRENAVQEYCGELEGRKAEIGLLMSGIEDAQRKTESQLKELQALMASVKKSSEDLKAEEQKVTELKQQEEHAREQITAIQKGSSELALLMTKVTWLLVEAKTSTGSKRSEEATKQLLDGLDEVVALVLSDPAERAKFVSGVVDSLPPQE